MRSGETAGAAALVRALGLQPHPEGGHYREVYRHVGEAGGRGACTSIYYLLQAGESSAWHRVTDAIEIWNFHGGDPLELSMAEEGRPVAAVRLGLDVAAGEVPQAVVPAGAWQAARPLGCWTLVGCAVAPAFEFASFEMAPAGWSPQAPEGEEG